MLQNVITLANINSSSSNPEGIEAVCTWFENAFTPMQPDTLERLALANGPALTISKRPQAPIQIFLGGHMDTVFPKNSPFQQVTKIDAHTVCGPGVTDMKGGLIVLLEGLKAFETYPISEKIGWRVFLNPDEEIGSPYSGPHIQKFAEGADFGLIFEPPLENGAYVLQRKGSATYKVISKGVAAHLGREPEKGQCAISALILFLTKALSLHSPRKGMIVGIGKIKGGTATNMVADQAEAWINVRCWDEKAFKKVNEKLLKLATKQGLTLERHSWRAPKPKTAEVEALFQALQEVSDTPLTSERTGGVCDGNLLAAINIPCLDTFGVLGGKLHTTEEYLLVDSVEQKSRLLTKFLLHVAEKGCHDFSSKRSRH